ncbi:MAG: hypothetical protein ACLSAH_12075 [Bilophila wadsworthia]
MRLPIVPAWFPLRALALQGVMALCVLLFCLAPLWYVTWKLEADIKELETRIQVQETLQPLMEGLNARREKPNASRSDQNPADAGHPPLIVTSLQEMVSLSGMQSSHFVPAAETVVEKNRIRLDGTLSGPPDNFRRLVLLLSEQPWLSGMEFLNVTPSGALPAYSLGIWATFTQQANTPRH